MKKMSTYKAFCTPFQELLNETFYQNEGGKWERNWTQELEVSILKKSEWNSQNDDEWGLRKKCLHEKMALTLFIMYERIEKIFISYIGLGIILWYT